MKFPKIPLELPFVSKKSYSELEARLNTSGELLRSEIILLNEQKKKTHEMGEIADSVQLRLNESEAKSASLEKELAESEDQRERILKGYEAMENELNSVKVKYGIALKQIAADETERAQKVELALDIDKAEFAFLRQANPQLITELMALVDRAGKYVAAGSLKIRQVEGIAYRDGAFDGLKAFKAHIASFLPAKAKKP